MWVISPPAIRIWVAVRARSAIGWRIVRYDEEERTDLAGIGRELLEIYSARAGALRPGHAAVGILRPVGPLVGQRPGGGQDRVAGGVPREDLPRG